MASADTLALVLGGGGARGAYQAGVLRFFARAGWVEHFPLITGVSAGAINAVHLASHVGDLKASTDDLVELWRSITIEQVFRTDARALSGSVFRWGLRLLSGGLLRPMLQPRGMVDTSPLRDFLNRGLGTEDGSLPGIRANIESGRLDAVAVTAINYCNGLSTTWVEGRDVELWRRPYRRGVETVLNVDHVLASTALPLFFPAVAVDGGWYGDGGVRLTAPLSPALHLGADRVIAVSAHYPRTVEESNESAITDYPPPAQILGVLLNSVLLDQLDYDAMQTMRFTDLLEELPEELRHSLRPAKVLTLRPSCDLGKLASEFEMKLPLTFRFLERGLGSRETKSPDFLSYMLFQHDYMERLIQLGEEDTERRAAEIESFLLEPSCSDAMMPTGRAY